MRQTDITGADVDAALGRLQGVLAPRVGKRMTRVVIENLLRVREQADAAAALGAIHATIDAYARMPESGTPFPLDVASGVGAAGCSKLTRLAWHQAQGAPAFAMLEAEARAVGAHANALLPTYGDDDVDFAVRVAWKNHHLFHLNLVVGVALDRNDPSPVHRLYDAWQRQGAPARAIPLGVVEAAAGTAGVVYAVGAAPTEVLARFRPAGFVFSPDEGDPIDLATLDGAQQFFARVPLPITPHALSWIVHVLRMSAADADARVEVEGGLLVEWQEREEQQRAPLASALLGIPEEAPPSRASIVVTLGAERRRYAPGELS